MSEYSTLELFRAAGVGHYVRLVCDREFWTSRSVRGKNPNKLLIDFHARLFSEFSMDDVSKRMEIALDYSESLPDKNLRQTYKELAMAYRFAINLQSEQSQVNIREDIKALPA